MLSYADEFLLIDIAKVEQMSEINNAYIFYFICIVSIGCLL